MMASSSTHSSDGKLTEGSPRSQRAALNDADEEYESSSGEGQNKGSGSYAISNMLMNGVSMVGGQKQYMPMYIIRLSSSDDEPTEEDQQHMNPDVPRSVGPNTRSPLLISNGSSSSQMTRQYTRPEIPHTSHADSASTSDGYLDPETIIPHHEEKAVGGYHTSVSDLPLVADGKPRAANLSNLHAKAIRDNSSTIPTHQSRATHNTQYQYPTPHPSKMPPQYLCELSRKVMTEPVRSIYGETCCLYTITTLKTMLLYYFINF